MNNGWIHERMGLIGTIDPQTVSNSEVFTDVIDMSKYQKVMAVFMLGNMPAETIVARCVTCDSGGTNAAAFKTASTLSAHASNNDNDQIIIELDGDELAEGGSNAERYVKFGLVTGGSTGGPAACAVFGEVKQPPATNHDLSSIVEIEVDQD